MKRALIYSSLVLGLGGCGLLGDEATGQRPGQSGGQGGDQGNGQDAQNAAPEIHKVFVTPGAIYVDGPAYCAADYSDPEGDPLEVSFTWRNATRGEVIGQGANITLSPADILPGEELACVVTVKDDAGNQISDSEFVEPVCGLYDPNNLSNISFSIDIMFRPWVTDDLEPGFGGEPWDWDGDVPDELFDLANFLDELLGWVNVFYPTPETMTAEEAIEYLIEIGYLVDEVAPVLLEATVPPDPDLFPYLIDSAGNIATYWEGDGIQWSDSYEASLTAERQDLYTYDYFAVDMEDIDLVFDDNMGDWIDQGDDPLVLAWPVFSEGAYCTSSYVNPTNYPQSSEVAFVPSSILWMQITVW